MYMIQFKPLATQNMNRIELANELCVLAIMYMINVLINPVITPLFRNYAGYVICIIACCNILGNLMFTMYIGKNEFMHSLRNRDERKNYNKRINDKIENRKKMLKIAPGKLEDWVCDIALYDAIRFCR
jgi:hypothetical protein